MALSFGGDPAFQTSAWFDETLDIGGWFSPGLVTSGPSGFSGALPLAGAGALILAASVGTTGALALGGAGALTSTSSPGLVQSLALSGSGSLGLSPLPTPVQTLALSGSGTVTFQALVAVTGAAGLSGSGTLTFAAIPTLVQMLALAGSGSLSLAQIYTGVFSTYAGSASGTGWVNPGNAAGAPDSAYATWTSSTSSEVSQPLVIDGFDFSILPGDAQVVRVTVAVKGFSA